ncbi:MAG: aa3-type cytochrome c oxidase subunit IV [Neorhizobium sp.]|jgi:hypothetical protein|nr:aa3-type cytochrome c oxidase subunit IV [Neorhizobium sp.]
MDEHHDGALETGAPMDYRQHEQTYNAFLALTKWGVMLVAVLMIAMAAGFFAGAGLLGGLFVFAVLSIAGVFLLQAG